jgi:ATP-dependent Lhr-like helicase
LYSLRRLEARGEIRGGRFVDQFAGEQFALPEAVSLLREVRRDKQRVQEVVISCADPLNLSGIITPGKRLAAQAGHRIFYRDGKPVANRQSGDVVFDGSVAEQDQGYVVQMLTQKPQAVMVQPETR